MGWNKNEFVTHVIHLPKAPQPFHTIVSTRDDQVAIANASSFSKLGVPRPVTARSVNPSDIDHNQLPLIAWKPIPPGSRNSDAPRLHETKKKIGRTGIPTNGRIEAFRTTSRVIAQRDIIQSSVPHPVQPRVQEAQSRLASINPCIVEHRNERRKGGRRAGCAGDVACLSSIDDEEVPGLRSDVGETLYRRRY
jgi:hypothetical protein